MSSPGSAHPPRPESGAGDVPGTGTAAAVPNSSVATVTVVLFPETMMSGITDSLRSLELQTLGRERIQVLVCSADYEADENELAAAIAGFSPTSAVLSERATSPVEQLNTALSRTCGEYITWLAAGDWYPRSYLADMLDLATSTGADLCVADHLVVDGFRRVLKYAPLGLRNSPMSGRSLIPPVEYSTLLDQLAPKLAFISAEACRSAQVVFDERLTTGYRDLWAWQLLLADPTAAAGYFPGPCIHVDNTVRPPVSDRDMSILCLMVLGYADTMVLTERAKALRLVFDWVLRTKSEGRTIDRRFQSELREQVRRFSTDAQAAALLSLKEDPRKTIAEFIGAGAHSWPR